jgi:putative DNA primase/helicase
MVVDYLETLLPESWDAMDLYRRIEYIRSPDDPTRASGSVRRNQVCVMEIWCECFGKSRESIKKADSYEIQGILNRIGGWSLFDGNKTGKKSLPIYGIQRVFVRTE